MQRRDWLKLGGFLSSASLLKAQPSSEQAEKSSLRGIIFLVSDGMSHGVLSIAENYSRLIRQRGTCWWSLIDHPRSVSGLMETSSANSYVTDSAAASSAWGGGVKVNNGSINVRPDGTESVPLFRRLKKSGYKTGLVTTASVTHATPAGFAAVTENRDDEHLIAPQYLNLVDVLLGGGRSFFTPSFFRPISLINRFSESDYACVKDRSSLLETKSPKVLGLFAEGHLPYEVDRFNHPTLREEVPSLTEMTGVALDSFLNSKEKFFLQIEGARIDHAAHSNDAAALVGEQLAFDDALALVMKQVGDRDDILVIVTSDHGNANPGLNASVKGQVDTNQAFQNLTLAKTSYDFLLKEWKNCSDQSWKTLLSFIQENLGFSIKKIEAEALLKAFTQDEFSPGNQQFAKVHGLLGQIAGNYHGIGWTGTNHTSDPTLITAIGPGAERFSGMIQNQEMYQHFLDLMA